MSGRRLLATTPQPRRMRVKAPKNSDPKIVAPGTAVSRSMKTPSSSSVDTGLFPPVAVDPAEFRTWGSSRPHRAGRSSQSTSRAPRIRAILHSCACKGGMNELSNDVWTAASMYYMQGETMDAIASHLRYISLDRISTSQAGTSVRSCVHHFVRANGATKDWIPPLTMFGKYHGCAREIRNHRDPPPRSSRQDRGTDGDRYGRAPPSVSPGTTLDAITHYVVPKDVKGVSVVQMNGRQTPLLQLYVGSILSRMAAAFGGEVIHFRSQPFFDSQQRPQCKNVPFAVLSTSRARSVVFSVGAP